jgi:hypothetical protein
LNPRYGLMLFLIFWIDGEAIGRSITNYLNIAGVVSSVEVCMIAFVIPLRLLVIDNWLLSMLEIVRIEVLFTMVM